jgi:transcriptional regulator with XRE-family HTH domain
LLINGDMRSKIAEIQIPLGLSQKKELARRVRLARISAGLGQAELAGLLCVSKFVIYRVEAGSTFPDFDLISGIARETGQSVDFFVV